MLVLRTIFVGAVRAVGDLLIWVAGADRTRLESKPERARYVGYGSMVVFTTLLAFVGMATALEYRFATTPAMYLAVALIYAFGIFTFDRVVTSHVSEHDGVRRVASYVPRLVAAAILAFGVSEPLVMRFYEPEISMQIAQDRRAAERVAAQEVRRSSPVALERAELDRQRKRNRDELAAADRRVDVALNAFDAEEDGRGGTRIPGYGPVAKAREAELARAREARAQVGRRVEPELARLDRAIAAAEQRAAAEIAKQQSTIDAGDGFLARQRALDTLIEKNPELRARRWMVALILLVLDLLPVLFKMAWPPSGHDRAIRSRARIAQARRAADEAAKVQIAKVQAEHLTNKIVRRATLLARAEERIENALLKAQLKRLEDQIAAGDLNVDVGSLFDLAMWDVLHESPLFDTAASAEPEPAGAAATSRPSRTRVRLWERGPLIRMRSVVEKLTIHLRVPVGIRLPGAIAVIALALSAAVGSASEPMKTLATAPVEPTAASTIPVGEVATVTIAEDSLSKAGHLVVSRGQRHGATALVGPLTFTLHGAQLRKPYTVDIAVPTAATARPPRLLSYDTTTRSWQPARAEWDPRTRRLRTTVSSAEVALMALA